MRSEAPRELLLAWCVLMLLGTNEAGTRQTRSTPGYETTRATEAKEQGVLELDGLRTPCPVLGNGAT